VIAISDRVRRVEEQQVEDEIDKRGVPVFERVLDEVEGRAAIRKDAAEFAASG
jgi:hypothetical protein